MTPAGLGPTNPDEQPQDGHSSVENPAAAASGEHIPHVFDNQPQPAGVLCEPQGSYAVTSSQNAHNTHVPVVGGDLALDQLDPSLLELVTSAAGSHSASDVVIDPTLFGLEAVVNDVRSGKVRVDGQPGDVRPVVQADGGVAVPAPGDGGHESHEIHLDDDGIDPALREIVNSLTNAQQGHSGPSASQLGHLPAQIGDRPHETIDASLTSALEDLQNGNFGAFFPHADNFLLPEQHASSSSTPLTHPPPETPAGLDSSLPSAPGDGDGEDGNGEGGGSAPPLESEPVRRGRGRPKGSKNKNPPLPKPPKPPKPPKDKKPAGKIGRPRKARTAEEEAEYELRLEEKRLGIKRKHGRPRKYPGYLVRDMRLKKNRAVYEAVVLNGAAGIPPPDGQDPHADADPQEQQHHLAGSHDGAAHMDGVEEAPYGDHHPYGPDGEDDGVIDSLVAQQHPREMTDQYDWHNDPHNLLGAVGAGMDLDRQDLDHEHDDGEPSTRAIGKSAEDMRDVFGLEPAMD